MTRRRRKRAKSGLICSIRLHLPAAVRRLPSCSLADFTSRSRQHRANLAKATWRQLQFAPIGRPAKVVALASGSSSPGAYQFISLIELARSLALAQIGHSKLRRECENRREKERKVDRNKIDRLNSIGLGNLRFVDHTDRRASAQLSSRREPLEAVIQLARAMTRPCRLESQVEAVKSWPVEPSRAEPDS